MKRRHHINFNIRKADEKRIRDAILEIECSQGLRAPQNERGLLSFAGIFDSDDPRLRAINRLVDRESIRSLERIEILYSDGELRAFPLLAFSVDRNPLGRAPSIAYGTDYDVSNACPRCGTGAVQTSHLMLPLAGLPPKAELALGCSFELLVGPRLRQALLEANVGGLELRQALFYQNREPLPWWQFMGTFEMPKMSKESNNLGRDTDPGWGCPVCKRDMHVCKNNEPLDYVYEYHAVDPETIPDVVRTWECFGRSVLHDDPERQLVRGFARPGILVKRKVFDIFRKLKAKRAIFLPVRFV